VQRTSDKTLTPKLQFQLYTLTGLVLLPHVNNLTLAITIYLFLALGLRLLSLKIPQIQPNKLTLFALTAIGIYLTYNQHQTLIGKDAGISLLSIMLVLKTLEVRKRRDLYITVFISYFVIITQFIFSQTISLFVFQLVLLITLTSLLISINRVNSENNLISPIKSAFVITIQALPIAIILFVMFPRLTHPLWHIGSDSSAQTGISEEIRPGMFSQLIESSEIAFRVTFKDTPPARESFYWRGLVLWDTDGISWFTDKHNPIDISRTELSINKDSVRTEVFLEPHRKTWLYALDLPSSAPKGSNLLKDFSLSLQNPVNQPKQYEVNSYLNYQQKRLPDEHRKRALKLADNITDRQRQLVSEWKNSATSDDQIVQLALEYFNHHNFVYTLNPPRYLNNPIDQFLFDEREGFCGHYATAFTQLMRLADIPTRIVIGYQGGEYNELGDYFTIRQYDAHAWTEVWLKNKGWLRVDPTAAVAPERVRTAIQPTFGAIGEPALFKINDSGWIGKGIAQLGMLLDTTGLQWRRWVLGFDRERQFSLMRGLGFNFTDIKYWGILTVVFIALALILIALYILSQSRLRVEPVLKLYQDFCQRLAAVGLTKLIHEGPLDYSKRIIQLRPDLSRDIKRITELYVDLRYGRPDEGDLENFTRQVRGFRPGRSSQQRSTVRKD
jgi:transglutaminase-like putative cysteine protease